MTREELNKAILTLEREGFSKETTRFIYNVCLNELDNKTSSYYSQYYFIVKVTEKGYQDICDLLPSGTYLDVIEKDEKHIVMIRTDVINLFIENATEKYERIV